MWTIEIIWLALLAVVVAEPPPPDGFSGYERGGYEIQPTGGDTGALQFPGGQEGQQTFGGGQQSGGQEGQQTFGGGQQPGGQEGQQTFGGGQPSGGGQGANEFSSPGGHDSGSNGQSQTGGFDSLSGQGFEGFASSPGQTGSQDQFGQSGSNELSQRGSQRFDAGAGSNSGSGSSRNNDGSDDYDDGDLGDIPGEPGKDYPIYGEIPKTSFRCQQQASPGYFADVETQCQVFHICQKGGQMDSVLCPNGTIFNQKVFVCSWWYDFDCDLAAGLFSLNEEVNAAGESAALSARQGGRGGTQGGDEGYSENGPSSGQVSDGYSENSLGGGGNSDGGSSFVNDGGQTQGHFSNDAQNGDVNFNDLQRNSAESFSGYTENGPDFAEIGGENFPSSQNSRGSARFGQSGQGYSDNGPNSGRQAGSNDLATSGDYFGNLAGSSQPGESGYSSDSNGNANGNGLRPGQNEGGESSPGYPSGREGDGDRDFSLPAEGRQTLLDLIGGPSRSGNGLGGSHDAPSSEYLPPKEDSSQDEGLGQQDRSYLPPGK